jgi:hypothetical protein
VPPKPPTAATRAAAREERAARRPGSPGRVSGFLANAGFALSSFDQIFSKYFPRIQQTVHVQAQGGPKAKGNAVVHTALAVAFGCIRQKRLGLVNLNVTVNHTKNSAEVVFSISSLALVEALSQGSRLLDYLTSREALDDFLKSQDAVAEVGSAATLGVVPPDLIRAAGEAIGEKWREEINALDRALTGGRITGAPPDKAERDRLQAELDDLTRQVADIQRRKQVPGVVRKGGPDDAGVPPDPPKANLQKPEQDQPATRMARAAFGIYKKVSQTLGQGIIWRLGRDEIRGAPAPAVLKKDLGAEAGGLFGVIGRVGDIATGADTFDKLTGQVILTRNPAPNPQMPAGAADKFGGFGFGTDLRTLVAQVLHDPGVRPPLPHTFAGPPPVPVEEFA